MIQAIIIDENHSALKIRGQLLLGNHSTSLDGLMLELYQLEPALQSAAIGSPMGHSWLEEGDGIELQVLAFLVDSDVKEKYLADLEWIPLLKTRTDQRFWHHYCQAVLAGYHPPPEADLDVFRFGNEKKMAGK